MPSLVLNTNIPKDGIPETFITEISSLMAKLMGKPEKYVCVHINPGQMMTFAGSTEPCAIVYVSCIGKLGVEENKSHTAALTEKITNDLKIDKERMYINFNDQKRSEVGWNGTTFA